MRPLMTLILLLTPMALFAEQPKAEFGHGLKPEDAAAGWISLFDGKTTFGWSGAKVTDGVLSGGTTTSEFGNCELKAEFERDGKLLVGGKEVVGAAGKTVAVAETGRRGTIQLAEGTALRKLMVRPLGLKALLNGKNLDGWKRIDRATLPEEKRPKWTVVDGTLTAVGGPGAVEYQGEKFGDVVIQIDARSRATHTNGGLFFRSIPGDFMNGYEAQIHSKCEDNDPAKPSRFSTGGIDDRQNARRLVSRDGETFRMTVIALGPHIATWVNGYQMTDWTDTRPKHDNPRQGLRTEAGTIQLQAHDPETDLEFRGLHAAEWK